MLNGRIPSLVGFIALLVASPLVAAPADVVASRIAGLRELGAAYKNVNDQLKSGTPQMFLVQLSARQIREKSRDQYGWFPAGSGPQPGIKTRAKPDIWAQPAQFKAAQDAFAAQANAFYQAAASGDAARIGTQARQLGQSCAACHRQFRVDERE